MHHAVRNELSLLSVMKWVFQAVAQGLQGKEAYKGRQKSAVRFCNHYWLADSVGIGEVTYRFHMQLTIWQPIWSKKHGYDTVEQKVYLVQKIYRKKKPVLDGHNRTNRK